jgi:hypothetical protein
MNSHPMRAVPFGPCPERTGRVFFDRFCGIGFTNVDRRARGGSSLGHGADRLFVLYAPAEPAVHEPDGAGRTVTQADGAGAGLVGGCSWRALAALSISALCTVANRAHAR